jgi:hypothetical protein
VNNKIDFIEITAAPFGATPGPITGSVGVNRPFVPIRQIQQQVGSLGGTVAVQ